MGESLTEKSRGSLPLILTASILVSVVTGTAAAVAAAYSFKEKTLEGIEARLQASAARNALERQEALSHYLSLEKFGEWRQQERIRTDAANYAVLNAIERLRMAVESRRR